jgi:hypothetical protein
MHRLAEKAGPGPFHYRLFGLNVESQLELPELPPVEPSGEPDVRIGLAAAGPHPGTLIAIDDVAKFYVEGGLRIRIVPEPGVPNRNVRLFLLGSAMGMLLHQRGLLPLHANAVEIAGKAVAVMGPSGSGKSTLAAWFHDCGYRVIADDVCVVRFDQAGGPWAEPGLPRLRLWKDALERSGRNHRHFERTRTGPEPLDKFDVPIRSNSSHEAIPLGAAYLLGTGDQLEISPLTGIAAADAVFANTYRGEFVTSSIMRPYWASSLQMVRQVPIFQAHRPWGRDALDRGCEALLRHAEHVATAGTGLASGE